MLSGDVDVNVNVNVNVGRRTDEAHPSVAPMRIAHVVVAFLVGACSTAAVQSSATSTSPEPAPAAPAAATWMPEISAAVIKAAAAEVRTAPSGKAGVTILARGENAFVAKLRMDAGAAVPVHRDATEEYIHVLSGGGTITVDGTEHAIAAGDTVYMPANAEVSFQNGDAELVGLQVFAGPEPASKYGAWDRSE